MPTLVAERIVTGYGKHEVVHGVSLEARAGEITCVFGPNGSGKSTLLKAIAGAIPIWSGRVALGGVELTGLPVHEVVRRGVVMLPQSGGIFPRLTVVENLRMGGYAIRDRRAVERRVARLLDEFPSLARRRTVPAGQLSGGERMMLAMARVLVAEPRFVLLDEPSAGLAPAMVADALARARALRDRGVGVLMVEQNIREALPIADVVHILVAGEARFHGRPDELADDRRLMDLYMGVT
ncbi:MAG TPA: ABC transporter ATP-binding protein [Thermodesulfobacteriota bacterium]